MLMISTPLPVWCDPMQGDSHPLMIIPMIHHQRDLPLPYHRSAAHPRYLIWPILSRIIGQVDWLKYALKRTKMRSLGFRDRGSYIYFLGCLTISRRGWGPHTYELMITPQCWIRAGDRWRRSRVRVWRKCTALNIGADAIGHGTVAVHVGFFSGCTLDVEWL